MVKMKTEIQGFDELASGGIEFGSRNVPFGALSTEEAVFARMQWY